MKKKLLILLMSLSIASVLLPTPTASTNPQPRVGVGVIVINSEGKILCGKRKNSHGDGKWGWPGGHLEYGETVAECAARELVEETGLKALDVLEGPWVNDVIAPGKHYITLFAIVHAYEGNPQLLEPDKCEYWEWFSWDELPEPLFAPIYTLIAKVGLSNLKKF